MVAQLDYKYFRTRPLKVIPRLISYFLFEGRPVTTRGQWFNPVVFKHLQLWSKIPYHSDLEKPIFILGAGRSGTTILGVVMSMHKEVAFLNEPKAIWHTIHPNEDVSGSYSTGDVRYRLDASDLTDPMRKKAIRLYGGFLRLTRARRVVDKYPELSFRAPFILDIFPDAKFIFLARNGWDTCASIDSWSQKHGEVVESRSHNWWGVDQKKWRLFLKQIIQKDSYFEQCAHEIGAFTNHVDMAAVEWIATMREGLYLKRKNPKNLHFVKYEELVKDPTNELLKIQEFCELPDDKIFLNFGKQTLVPGKRYDRYELHPSITSMFLDTMKELGFDA